ncbi:hypothetical protein RHMOL_Rhmol05G0234100 [Rhododendron molle]|uniref:Uncharacterized protein n=1 Tax=Rhododendron molle TaxID=49168 RepID=A0ACC0NTL1_RHOML|nr:hypothetical protein RHMOL_Rhmol05G0234100 [Rhododendron molle]
MAFESSSATCRDPKSTEKTSQSLLLTEDSQPLPKLPCEIVVEILSETSRQVSAATEVRLQVMAFFDF